MGCYIGDMRLELPRSEHVHHARIFDVVCAGETTTTVPGASFDGPFGSRLRYRPGVGAVSAALALVARGARVGLVTRFTDDTFGRDLRARLARTGMALEGATLGPAPRGILLLEGTRRGREVVPYRDEEVTFDVPDTWGASVLLLSGVSPVISQAASACRAARRVRREGGIVLLDLRARYHQWQGRDARCLHALVAAADVVRARAEDLAVLAWEEPNLAARLRKDAVLVVSRVEGLFVRGAFGELGVPARAVTESDRGANDELLADVAFDVSRGGRAALARAETWKKALDHATNAVRRP